MNELINGLHSLKYFSNNHVFPRKAVLFPETSTSFQINCDFCYTILREVYIHSSLKLEILLNSHFKS